MTVPLHPPLAGVVAVVGCDGAGKSTLCADLPAALHAGRPVAVRYLGQDSGNILAGIRRLPGVGEPIGRFLKRRSARAHADERAPAAPDLPTALVVHLLSRWRHAKFRRMLALARRGGLVVADRWPQAEVPGFWYDGPGLSPGAGSAAVRWLAAREARLYARMAAHRPALVIRLDVDAATAHARKPDHKPAMLRAKAAVLPTLGFNGAAILPLDGREPYPAVLAAAAAAARAALAGA